MLWTFLVKVMSFNFLSHLIFFPCDSCTISILHEDACLIICILEITVVLNLVDTGP